MANIARLSLPVQPDAVPRGASGGWLIAGLRSDEIKDVLRKRWAATLQLPYLKELAAAVLQRELVCLSVDSEGFQWLSFENSSSSSMHVAPPQPIPSQLRSQFPFDQIPGLAEFVENFGGLADGYLPPCPWFVPADQCQVVANCERYDWGVIGQWAGSLTLYDTGAGNSIVVSPDNRCAKWDHDIGPRDDEDPFCDLGWSMGKLMEEFLAYISLPETEAEDSPFYC